MIENNDATKEHMQDMGRVMNMWFNMMRDLHLKISTILMSFALVAIGFLLSYLSDNEFHGEGYATNANILASVGLLGSLFFWVGSVTCGIACLLENLNFSQSNANYFAARYMAATKAHYERASEETTKEDEYASNRKTKSSRLWNLQVCSFCLGAILLIFLVIVDFFTVG